MRYRALGADEIMFQTADPRSLGNLLRDRIALVHGLVAVAVAVHAHENAHVYDVQGPP